LLVVFVVGRWLCGELSGEVFEEGFEVILGGEVGLQLEGKCLVVECDGEGFGVFALGGGEDGFEVFAELVEERGVSGLFAGW
jgi:hypothetical protein